MIHPSRLPSPLSARNNRGATGHLPVKSIDARVCVARDIRENSRRGIALRGCPRIPAIRAAASSRDSRVSA